MDYKQMMDVENILSLYKKANCRDRINLFLEHRSLRNKFVNIDMMENHCCNFTWSEGKAV